MKILLIYPSGNQEIIGWGDLGAIAEPLALEYLAAGARADGHEVELLDLRLRPLELELTLYTYQPDVVGVTGYSMHVLRNLDICGRVKALLPECYTVVGGHHATLRPEDFFEPQVEGVVVGEGVGPFRQILSALQAVQVPQGIRGLWSRVDGSFTYGGDQLEIRVDDILPPDRTLVPADRARYFIDWMKPIALLRTTVGCPYRCTFCSLWRIMDGRYYKRDTDLVVEELRQIPERFVFLVDDEPFVNPTRMWELARAIEAADIGKEYFAYCRLDSLLRDLDLMRKWRSLGLRRLFFGIEAVFDDELSDYNKRQEKRQVIAGLRAARELGIQVFASFIVRPDYGRDDFRNLVAFIQEHEIDYPSFTILTPIPGTEMFGEQIEQITKRQPDGRPHWDYFDLQHPILPTLLSPEEFMREYRGLQAVFADAYRAASHPFYSGVAAPEPPVASGLPAVTTPQPRPAPMLP